MVLVIDHHSPPSQFLLECVGRWDGNHLWLDSRSGADSLRLPERAHRSAISRLEPEDRAAFAEDFPEQRRLFEVAEYFVIIQPDEVPTSAVAVAVPMSMGVVPGWQPSQTPDEL